MYPIEKYRFVQTGNKTIAISSYAGKTVRGVAKCDPRDVADSEMGKQIAALRCAKKIARRRSVRAERKLEEAARMVKQAQRRYEDMINYRNDAIVAEMDISHELDKILA